MRAARAKAVADSGVASFLDAAKLCHHLPTLVLDCRVTKVGELLGMTGEEVRCGQAHHNNTFLLPFIHPNPFRSNAFG